MAVRRRDAFGPRQPTSVLTRVATFIGCAAVLVLVLVIETVLPNNPTLGGMLLLAVLFATWLLPMPLAAVINVGALAVTLITALTGVVDPLTAKFQFVAVVVTVCLSELTVRSLMARDRAQVATTEQLRRFTADAAHELRNPLSALQSELEITLLQPRTPDELTATVRLALKNTRRLVKISESLLTLSRSDSGGLMTSVSRVDISDVLEEAFARWEGHATALGVGMTEQLDCEGVVEGDALLLGRLFDNLLENALAYTPRNGSVALALTPSPPGACAISVTDTGPGIPAGLRHAIFERFSRGDVSRSRKTGGAGLGLAICAAIVSAHKGTISLDDEHVAGTRIVVRLPVTRLSGRV
ncbi:MAG TPA: HAMP domain-containing sensor histidine kinase [Candidatus Saccharimonadales bacterium]|nr:HAMP domain-containing sensor histidine kinase [Candidatus Saccharimonadales bacterium]